jgi:glycogen synthase
MVKKILMTADTVSGLWTYALELCHALSAKDIQVALATMGQPLSVAQQQEARVLQNVKVFESGFRLEWMDEPWEETARAGEWLMKVRDSFQPDLVHLNGYVHGALDWNLPLLIGGHSCVFSWWQAVHGRLPPARWNRYRAEVTRGLKAAAHVVTPTSTMMDSLNKLYGPFSSIGVIPNGRDPDHFRVGKKLPIILSAGRLWDPAKNVDALVGIADRLPWPLYLAGESRFEGRNSNVPSKNGTPTRSPTYLGHLPFKELADRMAQASIFVMPARYEPFGFTVLEAAFSGCALVLGDIPSLRENWEGAAIFVNAGNRSQIQEVLEELIRDSRHLLDLAHRARERAEQFTAHRMAAGYMQTYEALCNSFFSVTH